MALNSVTGHNRSESVATMTEDEAAGHETDGAEVDETITERQNSLGLETELPTPVMSSPETDDHATSTVAQTELETPLTSRKVSVESIETEHVSALPEDASPTRGAHELCPPSGFDDFRSPSSLHVEVSNSPEYQHTAGWVESETKDPNEVELEGDRRRMSASELGLIPRGVSLRIKRRPGSIGLESDGKSLIRKSRLGKSSRGSDGSYEERDHPEHGRITSDSTFGEDMIITPSTSHASGLGSAPVSRSEERAAQVAKGHEGEERSASRLSIASNSTVAFGRAL